MEQEHWQTEKISCPVSQQLLCPRGWEPLQGICSLGRRNCLHLCRVSLGSWAGFLWQGFEVGRKLLWAAATLIFARTCSSQPQDRATAGQSCVHQLPAHGFGEKAMRWTMRPWAAGNVNQSLLSSAHCLASMSQQAGGAQEALRGHSRATDPQWPERFPTACDAMLSNQTMGMGVGRGSHGSETG